MQAELPIPKSLRTKKRRLRPASFLAGHRRRIAGISFLLMWKSLSLVSFGNALLASFFTLFLNNASYFWKT